MEVKKVENKVKHKVQGTQGTGSCDEWENVAKRSVISSLMSVGNKVSTSGLYLG